MTQVSVGIPVLNGGAMLREALDSVVSQTYRDLDIIISNNASTDETDAIAQEYAARDRRIRYFRQPRRLGATEHFRFIFEQSQAAWWLWAAHDDLRTENYVEVLLRAAERAPNASLAFTDVRFFSDRQTRAQTYSLLPVDLEPLPVDIFERHRRVSRGHLNGACTQIYGLIARRALSDFKQWSSGIVGIDRAMLHHLAAKGDFVYEPGAALYYYHPPNHVSGSLSHWRLRYRCLSLDHHAWVASDCAARVYRSGPGLERELMRMRLFGTIGRATHGGSLSAWAVGYLQDGYNALPEGVQRWWRALKATAHATSAKL